MQLFCKFPPFQNHELCYALESVLLSWRCAAREKQEKNGYVEVSFCPLIFSSVQNLFFLRLQKEYQCIFPSIHAQNRIEKGFFHRLISKTQIKRKWWSHCILDLDVLDVHEIPVAIEREPEKAA